MAAGQLIVVAVLLTCAFVAVVSLAVMVAVVLVTGRAHRSVAREADEVDRQVVQFDERFDRRLGSLSRSGLRVGPYASVTPMTTARTAAGQKVTAPAPKR